MSLAKQVGRVVINAEAQGRVAEFISGVRHLMLNPRGGADRAAEKSRASDRTIDFVRAAQTAGTTLTGGWGEQLAEFQISAAGVPPSLQGVSVFDTLLKDMLVVPPRTSVVILSSVLTSNPIAEAHIKPSTQFSLSAAELEMKKAAPWVAVSEELLHMGVPSALTAVQRGLREKMTRACNTIFIAAFAGVTSFVSSGVTSTGVRQDLRVLLSAVSSGSESKLYLVTTRTICEALSTLSDSGGAPAFPQMQDNGGTIAGIPVIPCDEMTSGEILLIDATQVADSPPAAGTTMVSLWQANLAAIIVERLYRGQTSAHRWCGTNNWRWLRRKFTSMTVSAIVAQLTPDEREQATRAILDKYQGRDLPEIIASLHLELIAHLSALEQRIGQLERKKR